MPENEDLPPNDPDYCTVASILHLSALSGFVTFIGFFGGPILVWLLQKDRHPQLETEMKQVVDFMLSNVIYATAVAIIGAVPSILTGLILAPFIFFLLLLFFYLPQLVFVLTCLLLGAYRAKSGTSYRYPLTLNLV